MHKSFGSASSIRIPRVRDTQTDNTARCHRFEVLSIRRKALRLWRLRKGNSSLRQCGDHQTMAAAWIVCPTYL